MRKLFLIALLAASCAKKAQSIPENLMSKEQMVAFLIDSHMAEGQLQAARVAKDSMEHVFSEIEYKLYQQHGIDSNQFIISYHYYLDHVEELADIYDAVIDSLSLREKMLINQGG